MTAKSQAVYIVALPVEEVGLSIFFNPQLHSQAPDANTELCGTKTRLLLPGNMLGEWQMLWAASQNRP